MSREITGDFNIEIRLGGTCNLVQVYRRIGVTVLSFGVDFNLFWEYLDPENEKPAVRPVF